MKKIISKGILFGLLAAMLFGLSGCSGSTGNTSAGNTGTAKPTSKKNDYPPIAEKVAQAEMKNLDGTTSKIADMKGKVLLLNMWATWCGPCRGEMPALVKMQEEHRDKGFEIIGLNTDDGDTKDMIDKFAAEMKLNYKLVWAPTEMQTALLKISNFGGIPQSFLIDRDGRLRGVFRGGGANEVQKLGELVAKVVNDDDTTDMVKPDNVAGDEKSSESTMVDIKSENNTAKKNADESKTKSGSK